MTQLAFDFPSIKTTNGHGRANGHGRHGRPHERKLAAALKIWLGELDAAQDLRRRQLHEIAELRAEIYRNAAKQGVTPATLRGVRTLLRKSN